MRIIFWSDSTDWHDFYGNVTAVRRLSRHKWEVTFWPTSALRPKLRQTILVIADHAFVEVL